MKKIMVSLLLAVSVQTFADAIDFRTYQPQGINVTEEYRKFMANPQSVSADLAGVRVILVEGVMGNYVDTVGKWFMNLFNQYDYFADQKRWLKSVGADYKQIKIETEDGSAKVARTITKALLKSDKPVLLLTHSKGGTDALVALVNNPALANKLVGWISIQTPFLGSPVADYLERTQPWKSLAHFILTLMGGSGESLKDLTTDRRVPYYENNKAAIEDIRNRVPILTFGSWKDDEPDKTDSIFEFSRNLMVKHMGVDNDGLVPWKSAILPNGYYVTVDGLDHASTVVNNKYIKLDKKRFTNALFNLLFQIKRSY
jgi:hypothetical protein